MSKQTTIQQFEHISVAQTKERLDKGEIKVVDIRDNQSFELGHIPSSFHLSNASMATFIDENAFDTPVVVVCYHGISSQQAAQYLIHQGFGQVYSMDGGFEVWRGNYEFTTGS